MKTLGCFLVFLAILAPFHGRGGPAGTKHPIPGVSMVSHADHGLALQARGCNPVYRVPLPMQQAAKHVRYRAVFPVATFNSGFFVGSLRCRKGRPDQFLSKLPCGIIGPPV